MVLNTNVVVAFIVTLKNVVVVVVVVVVVTQVWDDAFVLDHNTSPSSQLKDQGFHFLYALVVFGGGNGYLTKPCAPEHDN